MKDWSFCDQILQVASALDKKLNIFIFTFLNFNFSYFQNNFFFNISLGRGFPAHYQIHHCLKRFLKKL